MTTHSVEVDARTAARLEALRAAIERATGSDVTQKALLAELIRRALAGEDGVIESFQTGPEALSEEEVEAVLSGSSDWGFETSSEEIDDVLYDSEEEDEL